MNQTGETVPLGSYAFWAWNDELREPELLEQMKQFKKAGYRGFFMHSREGLETPYLSERWMELCRFCSEQGRAMGLIPLIYDEDKWPSGMAGGMITRAHPEYAAKAVVYIRETDAFEIRASRGHSWYSGNPPANNLSAESVRAFLDITHEAYRKAFGGTLDGKVGGFFTDEPNFWDFFFNLGPENRPALPYTDDLPAEFRRRRGYELNFRLLFFKEGDYRMHRHDYWRTLSELFCERYTKQIYDWCDAQGVRFCGHLLFENELGYQIRVCGAAMPNYRYLHIPGIDILGEQTEEYLTAKQCSSVARQYGKQTTISESYGCTGWDFTFEGQKRLWDFQCALGIGLRAQHLSFYSMHGLRKRDFPPAFSYQSESFRYNPVIDGYCARLSQAMAEGEPIREVLVVHPITGLWCECGSAPDEDLTNFDDNMGWTCPNMVSQNRQGNRLNRFAEALLKNGVDFDFGDEQLMAADGSVQDARLRIALASYSVVILPPTESIFRTTHELLRQFAAQGGLLIAIGPLPKLLEGRPAEVSIPGAVRASSAEEAIALAGSRLHPAARIENDRTGKIADLICVSRKLPDGELLAAVGGPQAQSCRITVREGFTAEEEDLLTGARRPVVLGLNHEFYTTFTRNDCRIYRLKRGEANLQPVEAPYRHPQASEPLIAVLSPAAEFSRTMPNALTLDRCRYSLEGEPFSDEMQLWQAQRAVRGRLGFKQIVGNGVDMRYLWVHEKKPTAKLKLRYVFRIDAMPEAPVYLCLENAEKMTVLCNGEPCERTDEWFVDKPIRRVRLNGCRPGTNTLELSCVYSHDMELEDVYIIGDFGVSPDRTITEEPKRLTLGDVTRQGYFNYPGSLRYRYRFQSEQEKGVLVLGDYRATLVVARIKGKPDVFLIHGNTAELELNRGENELELELVGSNRNLMGPFHNAYDGRLRIGWKDFRLEEGERDYTPAYLTKPFGLLSPCKILEVQP